MIIAYLRNRTRRRRSRNRSGTSRTARSCLRRNARPAIASETKAAGSAPTCRVRRRPDRARRWCARFARPRSGFLRIRNRDARHQGQAEDSRGQEERRCLLDPGDGYTRTDSGLCQGEPSRGHHEKVSLMPAYGADRLSDADLNDLVGYLTTLRKTPASCPLTP